MILYENLEISDLIVKVRERDDVAFSELVKRYTPMINRVITGFSSSFVSRDEAFSEACVAIHKAALSYDVGQTDVTFGLYARICVHRRLSDLFSASSREHIDDGIEVENIVVNDSVEAMLLFKEKVQSFISVARDVLSEYEYRVFLLYIQGYDTAAICKELSKDRKSVENAKARMLKTLRRESARFNELN